MDRQVQLELQVSEAQVFCFILSTLTIFCAEHVINQKFGDILLLIFAPLSR
jgi:hypothetical protein